VGIFVGDWKVRTSDLSLTPLAAVGGETRFTELDVAASDDTAWVGLDEELGAYWVWTYTRQGEGAVQLANATPGSTTTSAPSTAAVSRGPSRPRPLRLPSAESWRRYSSPAGAWLTRSVLRSARASWW